MSSSIGISRKHSGRTKTRSTSSNSSGTSPHRAPIGERPMSDEELLLVSDSGRTFKESEEGACQTTSDNTLIREATDLFSVPEEEKRDSQANFLSISSPTAAGASDTANSKPILHDPSAIDHEIAPEFESLVARHSIGSRRGNELRRSFRKSLAFDERRVLEDIESVREEELRPQPLETEAAAEAAKGGAERDGRRASKSSTKSSSEQSEASEKNGRCDSQKARLLRMVSISVFSYAVLAIFCLLSALVIMWIERPSEQDAKVLRRADLAKFVVEFSHFCVHNATDLLKFTTSVLELKDIVEELKPGFTSDTWTYDKSLIFIFTVVSSIGIHAKMLTNAGI